MPKREGRGVVVVTRTFWRDIRASVVTAPIDPNWPDEFILDTYTRAQGKLSVDHASELAASYAELARSFGLVIAPKNTSDLPMRALTRMPPPPRSCAIATCRNRVTRRTWSIIASYMSWSASAGHPAVCGDWLIR